MSVENLIQPNYRIIFENYPDIGLIPYRNFNEDEINSGKSSILDKPNLEQVSCVNENEAQQALLEYVNSNCCYSKSVIRDLNISRLESLDIERYVLTTFTETRELAYSYEPYVSGDIVSKGDRTLPWEFSVTPKKLFQNEIVRKEVENTSHLEDCFECDGKGFNFCRDCDGQGSKQCYSCHGIVRPMTRVADYHSHRVTEYVQYNNLDLNEKIVYSTQPEYCVACGNNGYIDCSRCNGKGMSNCVTCCNKKKLRWFLQVIVRFESHQDDQFKRSDLNTIPDYLIRKCKSKLTFSEEAKRVFPIKNYPNENINQASYDLVSSHSKKYMDSRILAQKQEVLIVPITKCFYKLKGKNKEKFFHVYGLDHRVYAPNYPTSCSCCSII